MAPTKKEKREDTGELLVSIEQFTRTRDSVIVSLTNLQVGLTHVQNGLTELLQAYIQHTASILAGGADNIEALRLPPQIAADANAVVEAAQTASNAVATAITGPGDNKKKRKREKKERDPNAPKRPLTAAFLYAQSARPIVKSDLEGALGPDQVLEPNAVNLEVNKRWNEMSEEDKEKWKASYRDSMEKYKKEQEAYLASKGVSAPADLHDDDPSDEAEAGALDSDASSESEDEVLPTPQAKAPSPPIGKTPRANKRQKITQTPQVNGSAPVSIAPAPAANTPVPIPLPTGNKPAQSHVLPPSSNIEAPAVGKDKKDKKKKDKPAPQPITPAPANHKESSPDETKKKSKSSRTTRLAEADENAEKENAKSTKKRDRSKRKSEGAAS